MTRDEILKLEHYLKKVFRLPLIQVRQRPRKDDSAEVFVDEPGYYDPVAVQKKVSRPLGRGRLE